MPPFLERAAAFVGGICKRALSLFTPWGRGRHSYRQDPIVRILLHLIAICLVLVVLTWLNRTLKVETWIRPPRFAPALRFYWLPILFCLFYAAAWIGWWLFQLIGPEGPSKAHPDLDAAWHEAMVALEEAGIALIDAPLFLVLGGSAAGDDALFIASQLDISIGNVPPELDAPFHIYAHTDGIYLTCPGVSLLGRQAAILAGAITDTDAPAVAAAVADGDDMFKTLRPKGKMKEVQAILARARDEGRGPDQLTEIEQEEIRQLVAQEESEMDRAQLKSHGSLLKNTAEIEEISARLRHLCRLVVRDRRPYCPVNGILLLIPFSATDTDEDANTYATVCDHDLRSIREVLQVHCPIFALLCDLDLFPGFHEFMERFPAEQRQRRLGQRFPLLPDLEPAKVHAMVEQGMEWICQTMIPNWVYRLFRLEMHGREDLERTVRGNARLYQWMCAVRNREKRLSRLLVRGVLAGSVGPPLFGGCYIAGTGSDMARDQAFVAGVFRRLVENQNYISWTEHAAANDARFQRWAGYGYFGLTAAVIVGIVAGMFMLIRGY